MDHLFIDILEEGAISIYSLDGDFETYYVFNHPTWDRRGFGRGRVYVSQDLDEHLTALVDALPERLAPFRDEPGTLIFAVRSVFAWDNSGGYLDSDNGRILDRHQICVLAGMAFVPGLASGYHLQPEDDVTRIIEQACLARAGRPCDQAHAVIQGVTEQARRVVQASHEYHQRYAAEREASKLRARELLRSYLTPEQRVEFDASKSFHLTGGDGYQYLVTCAPAHNVFRVEEGIKRVEYCLVTRTLVPVEDQMLTQMLLLEADPAHFHRKTNAWRLADDGSRIRIERDLQQEETEEPEVDEPDPMGFRELIRRTAPGEANEPIRLGRILPQVGCCDGGARHL